MKCKLKQGDSITMFNQGKAVRRFLILETEKIDTILNALLYEIDCDGKKPKKNQSGEAPFHWWTIQNHSNIHWEKS